MDSHGGFLSLHHSHCSCSLGLVFIRSQAESWLCDPLTGWCLSSSFLMSSVGRRLQSLACALCPSDERRSNPPDQSLVASSLQTSETQGCLLWQLSICCLPWWVEAAEPWLSFG